VTGSTELVATEAKAGTTEEAARPTTFTMSIQGGMLEALGINMYTTLGKCLVEFVANAFDAESPSVDIQVPVEEIAVARELVRAKAKAEAEAEAEAGGSATPQSKRGKVLLLALPPEVMVTIKDTGHGMTPKQVQDVFLPVNRKRRLDEAGEETHTKTESGKRFAMGRKGLGKLAGFGAAEQVRIETKRAGQNFATSFTMNYLKLASKTNLHDAELPAEYIEGKDLDDHYTLVELSGLKCDAVRNNIDSIRRTLAEAFFGITQEEFKITLNGDPVVAEPVEYEFTHPPSAAASGFASTSISIDDMTEPLDFQYAVKFRKMGAHLPAAKRGARIYCNNRLAAGPTLLDLPTGMHNFHAQSYMECIVVANELDRFGVDIINTNRTSLRQDSELVEKFLGNITDIMKAAIAAHAKFREGEAEKEIDANPDAQLMNKIAQQLPARTRRATKRLIRSMAAQHGIDSVEFSTIVPLVLSAANATEVLIKLSELGAHPDTIENVANQLRELAEIERNDALKLYRARKNGITALQILEQEGEAEWRETGFESKLHDLFKQHPWLVHPEFGRPVVSDEDMGKLTTKLAKYLGIDRFTKPTKDGAPDLRRPDLAFVLGDAQSATSITIVELKSPSLPLEHIHLDQLKSYMSKVEEFLEVEFPNMPCTVRGTLIGALPDATTSAEGCRQLLREIKKRGPTELWEVIGVRALIERAKKIYMEAIDTLQEELHDDDEPEGAPALPPSEEAPVALPPATSLPSSLNPADLVPQPAVAKNS
jgi:hypothetical protein